MAMEHGEAEAAPILFLVAATIIFGSTGSGKTIQFLRVLVGFYVTAHLAFERSCPGMMSAGQAEEQKTPKMTSSNERKSSPFYPLWSRWEIFIASQDDIDAAIQMLTEDSLSIRSGMIILPLYSHCHVQIRSCVFSNSSLEEKGGNINKYCRDP